MRREWLVVTAVASGLMIVFGVLMAVMYAVLPLMGGMEGLATEDQLVSTSAQFAVLGFYGLVIGGALARHVYLAMQGRPSRRFRPSLLWSLAALVFFSLAIVAGLAVLRLPPTPAGYLFPILQLVAVLAPPLLALGLFRAPASADAPAGLAPAAALGGISGRTSREDPYAAELTRRLAGPASWRRVLGSLAWGLGGGTLISMALELIGLLVVGVLAVLVLAVAVPDFNLQSLSAGVLGSEDCAAMQQTFGDPLLIAGLVLAVAVAVPLIEEPAKSLAVVILRRRLTSRFDALLYGAAAGVGFGMIESAVYNVGDLSLWWGTASLRIGTTLVHALASGLFGLGWYSFYHGGGRRGLLRYAGAGVLVHGLWNAMSVGIIVVGVQAGCRAELFTLLAEGNPAGYLLAGVAGAASVGAGVLLFLLARRVLKPDPGAPGA